MNKGVEQCNILKVQIYAQTSFETLAVIDFEEIDFFQKLNLK